MSEKTIYEIDGREFSTLEGFYDAISRAVVPGESWGRNLDAFNDMLRGGFGTPDEGFLLRWAHSALSRQRLGHPETVRQLELRLSHCHRSARASVAEDLQKARSGIGPTVFDWLVEIIRDHCAGGSQEDDGITLELL
jgi:RNAse (barnase) inhibitor barstar